MVYYVIFTARILQAFLKTIILQFSVEKNKKTHDFPKSAVLKYFTSNSWKERSVQLLEWLICSEEGSANEL